MNTGVEWQQMLFVQRAVAALLFMEVEFCLCIDSI